MNLPPEVYGALSLACAAHNRSLALVGFTRYVQRKHRDKWRAKFQKHLQRAQAYARKSAGIP